MKKPYILPAFHYIDIDTDRVVFTCNRSYGYAKLIGKYINWERYFRWPWIETVMSLHRVINQLRPYTHGKFLQRHFRYGLPQNKISLQVGIWNYTRYFVTIFESKKWTFLSLCLRTSERGLNARHCWNLREWTYICFDKCCTQYVI